MIEAAAFAPCSPKRAVGLMAGDGFVVGDGERGVSNFETSAGSSACFGASDSTVVASSLATPPLRFFGPFARPLRTSAKGAPATAGSLAAAWAGLDDLSSPAGLSDLEPAGELPLVGGPRARIPARAGLKRAASLLVGAATATGGYVLFFCSAGGEGLRFFERGKEMVFSSLSAGGNRCQALASHLVPHLLCH